MHGDRVLAGHVGVKLIEVERDKGIARPSKAEGPGILGIEDAVGVIGGEMHTDERQLSADDGEARAATVAADEVAIARAGARAFGRIKPIPHGAGSTDFKVVDDGADGVGSHAVRRAVGKHKHSRIRRITRRQSEHGIDRDVVLAAQRHCEFAEPEIRRLTRIVGVVTERRNGVGVGRTCWVVVLVESNGVAGAGVIVVGADEVRRRNHGDPRTIA